MKFYIKSLLRKGSDSYKCKKSLKYKEKIIGSVINFAHYHNKDSVKSFMEN